MFESRTNLSSWKADFSVQLFCGASVGLILPGAKIVSLRQDNAVALALHHRPVQGARDTYRVELRHGVNCVRSGTRQTLGIREPVPLI
ncbi:MAG: 2OG-Fe(II) oxygenase [Sphingobium limneticum]